MRKFKKVLAFALAAAMILTAAPVAPAQAAAAPAMNYKTKTIYVNGSKTYNNVDLGVKNASTKTYSRKFTTTTAGKKVVSVNATSGVVTAKKAGTATITATLTNKKTKKVYKKVTSKVTVKTATKTLKVSNTDAPTELVVGGTFDYNSKADSGASTSRTWSTSDKAVATINSKDGVLTAVAPGTVTVTVKEKYSGKSAKVTLTVVADQPVATQAGAKKIKVTNGKSMADATITLKKGGNTVTLAATNPTSITSDGKTIEIVTANKLTDGEYTVVIGDKEAKVSATTEKVSKITLLSEKAAAEKNAGAKKATAAYKVENQFGEDITKGTSVKVSGTDLVNQDVSTGEIVFDRGANGADYIINRDVVSVVIVHPETGVSVQATLTVSDMPAITELAFEGVYNIDGKVLTEDSDPTDYYALFTAKDQYNKAFKDYKKVSIGTDLYVTIAGGLTNLIANNQTAEKITKDGVDYLGVKLDYANTDSKLSAGVATVLAVSAGSGKNISDSITVVAGSKVNKITATAPGTVVAGEKTVIEYTAYDSNGAEVTSYDSLKDVTINGETISGSTKTKLAFEKDTNGKAKLVYDGRGDTVTTSSPKTLIYNFTTKSHQVSQVTINVREAAKPVEILGTKDVDLGILNGSTEGIKIKKENLKVEDQYGRTLDKEPLLKAIAGYTLSVEAQSATSNFDLGNEGTGNDLAQTIKLKPGVDATKTYSEKFTLKLTKGTSDPVLTVDINVVSSPADKLANYKISVDKIYSDGGVLYSKEVVVKGTRNGAEIALPKSEYSVDLSGTSFTLDTTKASKHAIYVNAASDVTEFTKDKTLTETTQKITITIANGDTFTQDVVISNVKPQVKEIVFNNSEEITFTSAAALDGTEIMKSVKEVKDTYGVNVKDTSKFPKFVPTFTFVDYKPATLSTSNGANDTELVWAAGFNSCTVTISYGGVKASKQVIAE